MALDCNYIRLRFLVGPVVGLTNSGGAGLASLLIVLVSGVAGVIAAAGCALSEVLPGDYLQPCVPSRFFRIGPSFFLLAPGTKFA